MDGSQLAPLFRREMVVEFAMLFLAAEPFHPLLAKSDSFVLCNDVGDIENELSREPGDASILSVSVTHL